MNDRPWRFLLWLPLLAGLSKIQLSCGFSSSTNTPPKQPIEESSSRATLFPNSRPVTPSDIATLMRQTGQVNPSKAAIGVPVSCACRHGFPQAFAMDPLPSYGGGRMNSGSLKLTCPHLVRAVDAMEDEGMISILSERVNITSDNNNSLQLLLQAEIQQTHQRHAQTRQEMISSTTELERIQSKLGEAGAKAFLNAGVAAASPGSTDLKCLHAWLADSLFSSISSAGNCDCGGAKTTSTTQTMMGTILRQELQARGVDIGGTSSCQTQCNPNLSLSLADPPKPRNKQRLRTGKEVERRRRRRKEQQQSSSSGC